MTCRAYQDLKIERVRRHGYKVSVISFCMLPPAQQDFVQPWIVGQGSGRYIGQQLSTVNPMRFVSDCIFCVDLSFIHFRRRDTFLIPAFHWMVVRIVTDLPGYWSCTSFFFLSTAM